MKETLPDFDDFCEKAKRYFADGEMENALDCCRKALGLIEGKDEFNHEKLRLLNNIGIALVRLNRFDSAVKAFGRALDISMSLGDKHNTANQLGNIGSAFRDLEEYDSALRYYHDALKIFEELDEINGIASQFANIAYIHAMKGEKRAALEWFEKAKAKFEFLGNQEQANLTLQNIKTLKSAISFGE